MRLSIGAIVVLVLISVTSCDSKLKPINEKNVSRGQALPIDGVWQLANPLASITGSETFRSEGGVFYVLKSPIRGYGSVFLKDLQANGPLKYSGLIVISTGKTNYYESPVVLEVLPNRELWGHLEIPAAKSWTDKPLIDDFKLNCVTLTSPENYEQAFGEHASGQALDLLQVIEKKQIRQKVDENTIIVPDVKEYVHEQEVRVDYKVSFNSTWSNDISLSAGIPIPTPIPFTLEAKIQNHYSRVFGQDCTQSKVVKRKVSLDTSKSKYFKIVEYDNLIIGEACYKVDGIIRTNPFSFQSDRVFEVVPLADRPQ